MRKSTLIQKPSAQIPKVFHQHEKVDLGIIKKKDLGIIKTK